MQCLVAAVTCLVNEENEIVIDPSRQKVEVRFIVIYLINFNPVWTYSVDDGVTDHYLRVEHCRQDTKPCWLLPSTIVKRSWSSATAKVKLPAKSFRNVCDSAKKPAKWYSTFTKRPSSGSFPRNYSKSIMSKAMSNTMFSIQHLFAIYQLNTFR